MTDLGYLSNISGAKIQDYCYFWLNHISSYFNERFSKSFLGYSQLVIFSECFNISPMHLFFYHHSVLDNAPMCCGFIWGCPRNYKTIESGSLQTFLESWEPLVHLKSTQLPAEHTLEPELMPEHHHSMVTGKVIRFESEQKPWLHTSPSYLAMTFAKPYMTLLRFRWHKPLFPNL